MKSLVDFFEENVQKYADNPYMWEKRDGSYQSTSYKEMQEQVYQFAAGMITIGVKKGDRLALLAEGRTWWVVAEMGMFYVGAIDVPISIQLNEPADLPFRLKHSGARMVVISSSQLKKIEAIQKELPDLEKIILMDPKDSYQENEVYMGDLMEEGKKLLERDFDSFRKVYESISPDDIANICYTSGTTADPKGIMLSQRNYTSNTEQALSLLMVPEHYKMFLFLPWDHSFAHTCGIFTIMSVGASIAALEMGKTSFETRKNISKNIQELKPELMFSVPTISKNFRNNIESAIRAKGNLTYSLFKTGLKVAYRYNGIARDKGKGLRALWKPIYALFDAVIFKKVREGMGGNMVYFFGGGRFWILSCKDFFTPLESPFTRGMDSPKPVPSLVPMVKTLIRWAHPD